MLVNACWPIFVSRMAAAEEKGALVLLGSGELASMKKREDLHNNSCSKSEIIQSRDQQVNANE